ncbi:hypothetical protein K457DRAFT_472703 [Linnemannia elongata AG-77]|uniref:Uncharacterized protein n=1 Tax=Linnemannia elongata AG-77 TaxID=1314771 RepID=A0A197JAE3_9FUNG|nr:hypothetical protein K457DRAFT_472703 [Linnemannia elongata AG-77]
MMASLFETSLGFISTALVSLANKQPTNSYIREKAIHAFLYALCVSSLSATSTIQSRFHPTPVVPYPPLPLPSSPRYCFFPLSLDPTNSYCQRKRCSCLVHTSKGAIVWETGSSGDSYVLFTDTDKGVLSPKAVLR